MTRTKAKISGGIDALGISRAWRLGGMLTSGLIAISTAPLAHAADDANTVQLEEIIITGTAGGAGIRKQEASYTITTISADEMTAAAPKNSSELLVQIPGVWAETNGGVAGGNVTVIGFPDAGDSPHLTYAINGAPIFGSSALSFFGHNWIFRLDDTINSVEGVIGGPGAIFAKGEPGLTVNYRLKEGGDETAGLIKYSGSDYGLQRIDGVLSGKLNDGLYYMVGGYAQAAEGVRSPGFLAEKGHQFTANLTKKLDSGKINLWTRITNDTGQGLTPFAVNGGAKSDLGTYTQLSDYTRFRQIQVGDSNNNGTGTPVYQTFDFGGGTGWTGSVSGVNAEFNTSDNTVLRDNMSFTSGQSYDYGIVPDGGAVLVSSLGLAPGAVKTQRSGRTLAPTDFVQEWGYWVVTKDLRSFTNDLSLAIKTGDTNDLTVGWYVANWSSRDWWSLNNQAPMQAINRGDLLSANVTCASIQAAGSGAGCWTFGLADTGDATSNAFYVADSFQVTPALRLDGGVRRERQTIDLVVDTPDGAYRYPDGTVNLVAPHISASKFSYTGAVNYDFSSSTGVFGRYTSSWGFPNLDNVRDGGGAAALQKITELEAGYKYTGSTWVLYATAFANKVDTSAALQGALPGAALPIVTNKAYGVMLDGKLHIESFSLGVNATLQRSTYDTVSTNRAIEGNKFIRQPDVRLKLTPAYTLVTGDWKTMLYGAVDYIGKRPADSNNTVFFPGYVTVDAGVKVDTPWQWAVQVVGQNITDRHDFTEGDPRGNISSNSRPILGRSVQFSVVYKF